MYIFVPKQISGRDDLESLSASIEALQRGDTITAARCYLKAGVELSSLYVWGGAHVRRQIGPFLVHLELLKLPENATLALKHIANRFMDRVNKIYVDSNYYVASTPLPCLTKGLANSGGNIYYDKHGNVVFYAYYKYYEGYDLLSMSFDEGLLTKVGVYWSELIMLRGPEAILETGQKIKKLFEQEAAGNTDTSSDIS